MPKLSYGIDKRKLRRAKKPKVIDVRLDPVKADEEERRFSKAVRTIMSVGGIGRGSAIAFLEYQWYRLPQPGPSRGGGPKLKELNGVVLQRMQELRAKGHSEAKVVDLTVEAIENKNLAGYPIPKGLSEHTLQRRYIPVVFEWPEKKWLLRLTVIGGSNRTLSVPKKVRNRKA